MITEAEGVDAALIDASGSEHGTDSSGEGSHPEVDLKALKAKLYSEGLNAGRNDVLRRLGFDSLDTATETLARYQTNDRATKTGDTEVSRLTSEISALKAKIGNLEPKASRLDNLLARTLNAELENAARGAGVLDSAVSDISRLVSDRVQWREDGSLAVFVPGEAGELVPTGTLPELMAELKATKPHLFAATQSGGSGNAIGTGNLPAGVGSNPQGRPFTRAPTVLEIGLGVQRKQ